MCGRRGVWRMLWLYRVVRSCMSFIRDIGDVSGIMVSSILNILASAIREKYGIMTTNDFSVGILSSFKISSSVLIFYAIRIMIRLRVLIFRLVINRLRMINRF